MGKQGTITSFFRPSSSSSVKSSKPAAASSSPATQKRPRSQSAVSNVPRKSTKPLKRLKRLSDTQDAEHDKDLAVEDAAPRSPSKLSRAAPSLTAANDTPSKELSPEEKKGNCKEKENFKRNCGTESVTSVEPVGNEHINLTSNDIKFSGDKICDDEQEGSDVEVSEADASDAETNSPPRDEKQSELDISRLATKRTWKNGSPVPYKFVADAFARVEEISGRLEIQAILTQLFRDIIVSTPEDLVPTIYLCINKLAPAHLGIELGIGEGILLKALSQVTGRTVGALKTTYKQLGDLGDVASSARTKQKTMFPPPPLTVPKVFSEFKTIAQISGKNTQDTKCGKIVKMMVASTKIEAKYIARALLGKLRIHLADKTVISALAAAFTLERLSAPTDVLLTVDGKKKAKMSTKEEAIEEALKEATETLNAVYSQLPVWDVIVSKLLDFKVVDQQLVEACKLMPGVPVSPMLAKPTKAIGEVLERFEGSTFTCEYKYDGERAQVHRLTDGSMKIYSRNAEDLTPKYPDLLRDLPQALQHKFKEASFIIDAEAVAYDVEKHKILPFQELQGRKRKDVNVDDVKVKVCIFAFDLLFFDGESLINQGLSERRQRLQNGFVERRGQFMFAVGHDSRDPDQIMNLLNESVKAGCEGLMVKALEGKNSTYEPANRSQNWLKVKKDYLDGCGDSLDLVPIGGYLGRGKRTGSYGAFLLACYDPDSEEYQSICKIGTGFSDADLENFAKLFKVGDDERVSRTVKSYYRAPVGEKLRPDVWFEPVQVWEVKCADLSISPQHTAAIGQVEEGKGIALRFPRFIRVREDKTPEGSTTAEQVAEFYMRQSSISNQG